MSKQLLALATAFAVASCSAPVETDGCDQPADGGTIRCTVAADCDDDDACTADRCSPDGICVHAPIGNMPGCNDACIDQCRPCMDGECPVNQCINGTVLVCPIDATPCDACTLMADGSWCC